MSLTCGLVGLPNVGKSTIFNAILKKCSAVAANFPFCTIEPNTGHVPVEDPRLHALSEISKSEKIVPVLLTCVDIAGLIKGAYKGEGLGNQFLGHIRECDLIIQVVRCFDDPDIVHVEGSIDPMRDYNIISLELQFADIAKIDKLAESKKLDPKFKDTIFKAKEHLSKGDFLSSAQWEHEELQFFAQHGLLTQKPMIVVANMESEKDMVHFEKIKELNPIKIFASLEVMMQDASDEERKEMLKEYGAESGLQSVLQTAYKKLDLISFFTTGKQETRAWKVKNGATMQEAASEIHTDFYKGFISADVVEYEKFIECEGWQKAKEKGLIKTCPKNAIVRDGDVCLFKTYN